MRGAGGGRWRGTRLTAWLARASRPSNPSFSPVHSILQPWTWNKFIFTTFVPSGRKYATQLKTLHDFTRSVIAERRKARAEGATSRIVGETNKQPFLDLLLDARDENGEPLNDEGV